MMFLSGPVKVDNDLSLAISRMQQNFGAYLKRAFTNAHVRRADVDTGAPHVILDKTFFQDKNSDVMIKNLRTIKSESPRMLSIQAEMLQDILTLSVDLGALSLECEYEMINHDVMKLLPVSSDGILNATIESTRAEGRVGYRITGDSLQAINFDVEYKMGRIHLQATYSEGGQKMHSQSTRESIDETILKGVRRDFERYFEDQLREQLNNVLQDVSLTQMFDEDDDLVKKYALRGLSRSTAANNLVDMFLVQIRKFISDWGYSQIDIEDLRKSFRYPFDSFSIFWGSFEATEGTARNLSTIYRTGDFSIHHEQNQMVIFGSLGLNELACNYESYRAKVWNIGPSGKISATTGHNSVKLRIVSTGWITSIENAADKIIDLDFKVERIDDIKVSITGLWILNNLASTFISWIAALFNSSIIVLVEDTIKQQMRQFLSLKS
ncbi:uncharacterized protein LOC132261840 [Phlebotomus argentipes]|uniref:uncharacterized protein LOC132261840 n=1 Tax=Phlebotomus argentipes TaxID=94469 RepID=UPI0028937FBE|nr:uncharacterized protein LOC132261840 [Phlebotomus argentipes]